MPKIHSSILIIFFSLFILPILGGNFREESNVLILNQDNFDDAIRSHSHILVEFYSPFGKNHQKLTADFAKAAQKLNKEKSPIKLAKVDATSEIELARKLLIRSYPTLKFFVNGELKEYTGGKTESEILEWIRPYGKPATKRIESLDDFEKTLNENNVVLVYWGSNTGFDHTTFASLAPVYTDVVFVSTESQEVMTKYSIGESAKITLYKKFDEQRTDFTGHIHRERLSWFIRDNKEPLVAEFDPKNSRKLFSGKVPAVIVILADNEESKVALECLPAVAGHLKDKIVMVKVSDENKWKAQLLKELNANDRDLPLLSVVKPTPYGPVSYFYQDTGINGEVILQFLHEFWGNKKTANYRSERVPSSEGAVKEIVGRTFKRIVMDDSKNVFVLLYSQWDKKFTKIFKVWEELAEKAKRKEDLIIARMDTSLNEADGLITQSFPSFVLYPKNNKTHVSKYHGPKRVDDLWNWIETKLIAQQEMTEDESEASDTNAANWKQESEDSEKSDDVIVQEEGNIPDSPIEGEGNVEEELNKESQIDREQKPILEEAKTNDEENEKQIEKVEEEKLKTEEPGSVPQAEETKNDEENSQGSEKPAEDSKEEVKDDATTNEVNNKESLGRVQETTEETKKEEPTAAPSVEDQAVSQEKSEHIEKTSEEIKDWTKNQDL